MLGTAGYMAPEQVRGKSCDARTDVFALGCLLYELVTERRAFAGATPAESCGAVLRDHPPPPSGTVPELPPAFDRIIEGCLAKRPADRFSTGHDVALALEAVSGGRGAADDHGSAGAAAAPGEAPLAAGRRRFRRGVGGDCGAAAARAGAAR